MSTFTFNSFHHLKCHVLIGKVRLYFSNGMECNELNITEILVQLDVTVGRFLQNCSHTFQSEVNFQAKRFKLLMIKKSVIVIKLFIIIFSSVFSVYSEIMERKRKIACLLLALAGEEFFQSQKRRRVRRFYVRKSNTSRSTKGDFNSLVYETQRLNDPSFEAIFHMTKTVFADLLQLVAPNLSKKLTHRYPIFPAERLALTLRLLSTGDQQSSVAASYGMDRSTLNIIFNETCDVLCTVLSEQFMPRPTKNRWRQIAQEFQTQWNFPLCLGAVGAKQIRIRAPANSGSLYYNNKGFFSIILLAVVDANYSFVCIDVGAYGRQSDGGVLATSKFGHQLRAGLLDLPNVNEAENRLKHYVFLGDEAFTLRKDVMRPYPGSALDKNQRIFNYRLSRARRVVENAFGILVARWGIFKKCINSEPQNIEKIVAAACCLHNYCLAMSKNLYSPEGFVDSEDSTGHIQQGSWHETAAFPDLLPSGSRSTEYARQVRKSFLTYFISEQGELSFQHNSI